MAKILNPQGRRRHQREKTQQGGKDMTKETVGTHFVNGAKVFENKKDNHGFIFNMTR